MAEMILRNDKQLGRGRGNFGRGGGNTPGRGRGTPTGRGTGKNVTTNVKTPVKGNESSASVTTVHEKKQANLPQPRNNHRRLIPHQQLLTT